MPAKIKRDSQQPNRSDKRERTKSFFSSLFHEQTPEHSSDDPDPNLEINSSVALRPAYGAISRRNSGFSFDAKSLFDEESDVPKPETAPLSSLFDNMLDINEIKDNKNGLSMQEQSFQDLENFLHHHQEKHQREQELLKLSEIDMIRQGKTESKAHANRRDALKASLAYQKEIINEFFVKANKEKNIIYAYAANIALERFHKYDENYLHRVYFGEFGLFSLITKKASIQNYREVFDLLKKIVVKESHKSAVDDIFRLTPEMQELIDNSNVTIDKSAIQTIKEWIDLGNQRCQGNKFNQKDHSRRIIDTLKSLLQENHKHTTGLAHSHKEKGQNNDTKYNIPPPQYSAKFVKTFTNTEVFKNFSILMTTLVLLNSQQKVTVNFQSALNKWLICLAKIEGRSSKDSIMTMFVKTLHFYGGTELLQQTLPNLPTSVIASAAFLSASTRKDTTIKCDKARTDLSKWLKQHAAAVSNAQVTPIALKSTSIYASLSQALTVLQLMQTYSQRHIKSTNTNAHVAFSKLYQAVASFASHNDTEQVSTTTEVKLNKSIINKRELIDSNLNEWLSELAKISPADSEAILIQFISILESVGGSNLIKQVFPNMPDTVRNVASIITQKPSAFNSRRMNKAKKDLSAWLQTKSIKRKDTILADSTSEESSSIEETPDRKISPTP